MPCKKDFDGWNIDKKHLHNQDFKNSIHPKARQIWFVKLGVNIGFESDGKGEYTRPILVLSKIGSLYWWGVPLTSQLKENIFHYTLESIQFEGVENSVVMLSQAKILDARRFQEKIGIISVQEFRIIQKKMRDLYFPSFL